MVVPSASPPAVSAPCDSTCVFERMQRAVNGLPYPPYIAFTFEDETRSQYHTQSELLRVLVRSADGAAVMTVIRDFQGNTISKPRAQVVANGLDFMTVSNVLRLGDFPLADFGLRYVRPVRPDFFEGSGPAATPSALKVITTVTASRGMPYRIVDRGPTKIDGNGVYHFELIPLRFPKHNVLREIWIDATTYLPVRYVAERYVEDYPGDYYSYRITVDARDLDGRLVNVEAQGQNWYRNWFSQWLVSSVSFPEAEPDWVFDHEQWRVHDGEPIPNLAPSSPPP